MKHASWCSPVTWANPSPIVRDPTRIETADDCSSSRLTATAYIAR